jgi:hypothetical protein
MEQLQAGLIVSLTVSHHVTRSIQRDDHIFVGCFNAKFQARCHCEPPNAFAPHVEYHQSDRSAVTWQAHCRKKKRPQEARPEAASEGNGSVATED